MTDNDELITWLNYLKSSCSGFAGRGTILPNIRLESFKFIIDETIIKIHELEENNYDKQQT